MARLAGGARALALSLIVTNCGPSNLAAPPPHRRSAAAAAPAKPSLPAAAGQAFADAEPGYAFRDAERQRKLASSFDAIDKMAEEQMRQQNLVGLALGIVIDGELAHERGIGVTDLDSKVPPTADTVYRIGSITKSFTALALLSLRDEGALSLDEPLTRLLPEARGLVYPTRDAPPITLRHLLTHTSGLPRMGRARNRERGTTERELLDSLAAFQLVNVPGTTYEYSNLGFGLLGVVVARAAKAPYREVMGRRLLSPLGMTSTYWDAADVPRGRFATPYAPRPGGAPRKVEPEKIGAGEGAGGLFSTVRDMARYVALQLDAYPPRNAPEKQPLKRSSVREAHATGFRTGLRVRLEEEAKKGEHLVAATAETYGFGWVGEQTCDFDSLVWHNGGIDGFSADMAFLPKHGVGVVVLTNLVGAAPEAIAKRALDALRKSGGLVERTPALPAEFDAAMRKFLTVYERWDDSAYAAMLSAGRDKLPEEKNEMAGYKARHGGCKGYTPLAVLGPRRAVLKMDCERGRLEMSIALGTDGLINGFSGTSYDPTTSPELRKLADRLAALVSRWDEAVYKKQVAPLSKKTRDDVRAQFEKLRAAHGACAVKSSMHVVFDRKFELACDRGGDRTLLLKLDPNDQEKVTGFLFERVRAGTCPVQ